MKQNKKKKNKIDISQNIERLLNHKYLKIFLLLIVAFVFFSNYSANYDKKIDNNGDNIYYFSLGKSIADGNGYTNTMSWNETPHSHFPPGYPAFIAGILKISPDNIQAVKKTNGVLFFLSVFLFYFIIIRLTKNTFLAFCVSILVSMHSELLRFSTIMMSESLFIFLSLFAVFLVLEILDRSFLKQKKWITIVLIILLAAVTCYGYFVRSMGLSFIIALSLWLTVLSVISFIKWMKSKKKSKPDCMIKKEFFLRIIVLTSIVCSFALTKTFWDVRNHKIGKTEGSYTAQFMKKSGGETMTTMEEWKTRVKSNVSNFVSRWIPNTVCFKSYDKDKEISAKEWVIGISFLLLMGAGAFYMKSAILLFLFYLGGTVAVLVFYPEQYGGTRYLIPIIPLFIFTFLNGISACIFLMSKLIKKITSPLWIQSLVVILVTFIFLVPVYSDAQVNQRKMAQRKSIKTMNDANAVYYINACEWCGENLSDTTRMVCRKPEIFYMYSKYHKAMNFPQYAEVDTVYNLLKNNHATHVIIDNWYRHAMVTLFPVIQKYPDKFKMIKQIGEVDTLHKIYPDYIFEFHDEWGYHGDIVEGKKEGKGYQIFQDQRKYVGEFKNDQITGYGELFDSAGTLLAKGYWENGTLIRAK